MKRSPLKRKSWLISKPTKIKFYAKTGDPIFFKGLRTGKLKRHGKSPIAKCKARIQVLLTQGVRERDKGCIFRNYPETGRCGGVTAADHIITRQIASTYGDLRNCICSCWAHHKFFKEKNPTIYAKIVEDYIGTKTYNLIHKIARESEPKTLKEWEKIEEKLSTENYTTTN